MHAVAAYSEQSFTYNNQTLHVLGNEEYSLQEHFDYIGFTNYIASYTVYVFFPCQFQVEYNDKVFGTGNFCSSVTTNFLTV